MEKKVRIVLETSWFRFGYEKVTIEPKKEVKQLPRETKGQTLDVYA